MLSRHHNIASREQTLFCLGRISYCFTRARPSLFPETNLLLLACLHNLGCCCFLVGVLTLKCLSLFCLHLIPHVTFTPPHTLSVSWGRGAWGGRGGEDTPPNLRQRFCKSETAGPFWKGQDMSHVQEGTIGDVRLLRGQSSVLCILVTALSPTCSVLIVI